jgi:leucine-rich PPR motif-containing protein, mitochondrial
MESARGILTVMKQAGMEPTADTFTALLCGHAKQGDIEAIRAVIAECEAQNIELLDRDFMEVIFSLAKAGHVDLIQEVNLTCPKLSC